MCNILKSISTIHTVVNVDILKTTIDMTVVVRLPLVLICWYVSMSELYSCCMLLKVYVCNKFKNYSKENYCMNNAIYLPRLNAGETAAPVGPVNKI